MQTIPGDMESQDLAMITDSRELVPLWAKVRNACHDVDAINRKIKFRLKMGGGTGTGDMLDLITAEDAAEVAAEVLLRGIGELIRRDLAKAPAAGVLSEVNLERGRQDSLWGEQNHPDGTRLDGDVDDAIDLRSAADFHAQRGTLTWRHILAEEVAEAFAEEDVTLLRTELVQVCAVAVAWIQAIDRRAAG